MDKTGLQRGLGNVVALPAAPKWLVTEPGRRRSRRAYLAWFSVSAALIVPAAPAQQTPSTGSGQAFPVKPVRVMVSAAAGTGLDATTRLMSPKLSEYWRQAVVIDNRPGIIANNTVARAAPDGYTLLFVSGSIAVRHVMFNDLPYNTLKDFAGVTEMYNGNSVVVVGPQMGVKSVKELIAFAQARPGKVYFSAAVAGGMDHMNTERFRLAAGIKAQHVSFKGSTESAIEVAAGRAHFTVLSPLIAQSLVSDGKVIAILQRYPSLPGVPLIADVLPEWTVVGASAVFAPAGTPLALRQQIGRDIARVLNHPELKARWDAAGIHIATTTPEEHEKRLRADIAAFAKVMKEIGLKPN